MTDKIPLLCGQEIYANDNYCVITGEVVHAIADTIVRVDGYHVVNKITGYAEGEFRSLPSAISYADLWNEALIALDERTNPDGEEVH